MKFSCVKMLKSLDDETLKTELNYIAKMGLDCWYLKFDGVEVIDEKICVMDEYGYPRNYYISNEWCVKDEGGE